MSLARAACLTLRRRRALTVWAGLLAIGVPLVVEIVLAVLHAHDPVSHSPAGGTHTFARMTDTLVLALVVMAAIVGATAGAGDLSAGTFRDLVTTGCPRRSLFLARIPGALAVTIPLAALGIAVITAACYSFADGLSTPTAAQALGIALHVLIVTAATTVVTVGVAELVGSRGIAIGVLLGWVLAGEQLLQNISILGRSRDALLGPALDRFRPLLETGDAHVLPMSVLTACVVVLTWGVVGTAAGVWSVRRRDA